MVFSDRIRPDDVGLRDDLRFSHEMNTAAGHSRNPPIITYKSIIRSKNFEVNSYEPTGTVSIHQK
jgi:cysteamine dioxygenase